MTSLWMVIALIVVFCTIYLYLSIKRDNQNFNHEVKADKSKAMLIFPLAFLFVTPWVYINWGTYQKQHDWVEVNTKSDNLLEKGRESDVEMSMQEVMLAVRTQASQNPDNGELWVTLGQAYANLRMNDLALASMQRALRIDNNPDWLVATAQLLASEKSLENLNRAKSLLQQALSQNSEHQSGLLTLGFTYLKLTDYTGAITVWERLAAMPGISTQSKAFIEQQIQVARRLLASSQASDN